MKLRTLLEGETSVKGLVSEFLKIWHTDGNEEDILDDFEDFKDEKATKKIDKLAEHIVETVEAYAADAVSVSGSEEILNMSTQELMEDIGLAILTLYDEEGEVV